GLAVGRFRVVSGIAHAPRPVEIQVGVARTSSVAAGTVLRMATRALERLSRLYVPYAWKTYTIVVPPDLHSVGIEYPTLTFIGASPILRIIVDHETPHQWFYSLVGNDQTRDPWLDEAPATWGQVQLGGGLPGSIVGSPDAEFQHVGSPMTYWNQHQVRYFREVYGGGVVALASLGPARRVNCALRHY